MAASAAFSSIPLDETASSSSQSSSYRDVNSRPVPDYRFKQNREPESPSTLRARMPPPPPPLLPRNNNPVQQMHREGRLPGQRELDFYEKMTPENRRFTKLYTATLLLHAAAFGVVVYSWYLINWEPLFSDEAKKGLFAAFRMKGAGGLVLWNFMGALWSLACFVWLHNNLEPFPSLPSVITDVAVGAPLLVWVLMAVMALNRKWNGRSEYGEDWDPCTAAGADKWKQAPCGELRDWVAGVQVMALAAAVGAV